jgi:hypothetical protein
MAKGIDQGADQSDSEAVYRVCIKTFKILVHFMVLDIIVDQTIEDID